MTLRKKQFSAEQPKKTLSKIREYFLLWFEIEIWFRREISRLARARFPTTFSQSFLFGDQLQHYYCRLPEELQVFSCDQFPLNNQRSHLVAALFQSTYILHSLPRSNLRMRHSTETWCSDAPSFSESKVYTYHEPWRLVCYVVINVRVPTQGLRVHFAQCWSVAQTTMAPNLWYCQPRGTLVIHKVYCAESSVVDAFGNLATNYIQFHKQLDLVIILWSWRHEGDSQPGETCTLASNHSKLFDARCLHHPSKHQVRRRHVKRQRLDPSRSYC